jgi:hypothetical protein
MRSPFAYLVDRYQRYQAAFLRKRGRAITTIVQQSQTVDDINHHVVAEQRYIHFISATWTDPRTGKAHVFQRQFRSWREVHFKIGDMVRVRIAPHNYRHYLIEVG